MTQGGVVAGRVFRAEKRACAKSGRQREQGELEELKEAGCGELSMKDGQDERDAAEEVGSQACSEL